MSRRDWALVMAVGLLAGACHGSAPSAGPSPTSAGPSPTKEALEAGERASLARLPADPGHELIEDNCLVCHESAMIQQQHKDSLAWTRTVTLMRRWGARLPEDRVPALVDYLTRHFGPVSR